MKKRLLFITQKVDLNDDVLGFVHGWIEKIAQKLDKLYVICLEKRKYNLPKNVEVYSLGKEESNFQFSIFNFQLISNFKIFKRFKYIWLFYKYILSERKNYDGVFVHMNPEYVILGGLFWRLWRKKAVLWYTHKAVNLKLRIAEKLINKILTASPESCRLKSKKIEVLGHGIDTEKFQIPNYKSKSQINSKACPESVEGFQIPNSKPKILSVGRISLIKDLETLIKAIHIFVTNYQLPITCLIIGQPLLEKDKIYFQELKNLIKEKKLEDQIKFLGAVHYQEISKYYQEADLLVSTSLTGSIDKVPLEAMVCGLPVLTCNKAFRSILGKYKDQLMFEKQNPKDLAEKILAVSQLGNEEIRQLREYLKEEVVKNHSLDGLIKKIIKFYV